MSRNLDNIVVATIVRIIREVPQGVSRSNLMEAAKEMSKEASLERGWDNYSTAAGLDWKSETFKLAAEVRHPRPDDTKISKFREMVLRRINFKLSGEEYDSDVGERTRVFDYNIDVALPDLTGIKAENVHEDDYHVAPSMNG